MRHDQFAELAGKTLEQIAASLEEDDPRVGRGITSMRANELRVAAHVVRDLSETVIRREELGSSADKLPLGGPS